jgi:predicted metal-binding protein
MKVSTTVKCPGCKDEMRLTYKKPGLFSSVVLSTGCNSCESDLMFKIIKPQIRERKNPDSVRVESRVMRHSPKLLQLLKEEAEWNKLSAAEQDQKVEATA